MSLFRSGNCLECQDHDAALQ
ncbi:rCG40848, partial [Rattus norvegicus]